MFSFQNYRHPIFCQRLARVTHRHARETKRFGEVVQQIAYALGGRPGERLSSRSGLPVSDDTLLRRIKQWAKSRPPTKPIRVVGVDDWAWRKGYGRYGTILVDLKRRKVADLLPECSAVGLEQWLRQHPKIFLREVVVTASRNCTPGVTAGHHQIEGCIEVYTSSQSAAVNP